jgi:hypothetical protein
MEKLPQKNIDLNQIKINFDQENKEEKIEEKDLSGRTREDIEKESKSLVKEVIDSITLKDGQWYIKDILAGQWIEAQNKGDEKDENYYKKGQW